MVVASQVDFWGYNLLTQGISADPEKLNMIKDFHTYEPHRHAFIHGNINQLAEFSPDIAATA